MFNIESCAKQQIYINNLSEKRVSAQIPSEQHSHFRWPLKDLRIWHNSELIATKICCQTFLI